MPDIGFFLSKHKRRKRNKQTNKDMRFHGLKENVLELYSPRKLKTMKRKILDFFGGGTNQSRQKSTIVTFSSRALLKVCSFFCSVGAN
jgi:hypothetical protein